MFTARIITADIEIIDFVVCDMQLRLTIAVDSQS